VSPRQVLAACACVLVIAGAAACSRTKGQVAPVAGLLGTSGPVYLVKGKEQVPLKVGALLRPEDVVRADGVAIIEFFNDAVCAVESGTAQVGNLPEVKLASSNLPHRVLKDGAVQEAPLRASVVAVRYVDPNVTPAGSLEQSKDTVSNNFRDFMAAGGHTFGEAEERPEGPPGPLPPPPFREKLPRVHEGGKVVDGPLLVLGDGLAVAEDATFGTWTFTGGQRGALGAARRLRLLAGARATLRLSTGAELSLEGPLDLDLRR